MKSYTGFILFALLSLILRSSSSYITGSHSLLEYQIEELRNASDSTHIGQYYCAKFQSTVEDDSQNPTSINLNQNYTFTQSSCVAFYSLSIDSSVSTQVINVDLAVTSQNWKVLLAYKVGSPPLMEYSADLNITYDSVQFDFDGSIILISSAQSVLFG